MPSLTCSCWRSWPTRSRLSSSSGGDLAGIGRLLLDGDRPLHAAAFEVGHRPGVEAGADGVEVDADGAGLVELQPSRGAVHVHLEIVDDDLIDPGVTEEVGLELVFEAGRRGDLPAIGLSGDQLEVLLADVEIAVLGAEDQLRQQLGAARRLLGRARLGRRGCGSIVVIVDGEHRLRCHQGSQDGKGRDRMFSHRFILCWRENQSGDTTTPKWQAADSDGLAWNRPAHWWSASWFGSRSTLRSSATV